MATVSVFICPGGAQYISTDGAGNQYAACVTGQGSYQSVELDSPFDASTLNSVELAGAWTAGMIVMGTGACIMWAVAHVVKAVKQF